MADVAIVDETGVSMDDLERIIMLEERVNEFILSAKHFMDTVEPIEWRGALHELKEAERLSGEILYMKMMLALKKLNNVGE